MQPLTAPDLLRVWEMGQGKSGWQRALLLLAPCLPHQKFSELAALPLSRRNALLLEVRRLLVGPTLHCLVYCPVCREPLEFAVDVQEILAAQPQIGDARPRLTSLDLAAAAEAHDVVLARDALARRAASLFVNPLSNTNASLAEALAEDDPLADPRIPLACAVGEHVWAASLDISSYLWVEVDHIARQLLEQVREVAKLYGWSETEILRMSSARRSFYLEAASA